MITIPPGFDINLLASDFFALGAVLVSVAGIITTFHLIKKFGGRI